MQRRSFFLTLAAAQGVIPGANDRIRAGIIGAGGRGHYLIGEFKETRRRNGRRVRHLRAESAGRPESGLHRRQALSRLPQLLDDKSLDAVIVATPDHWHARMVIDAVEAGKDVYVEKPMAHKIDEGFDVIDAVRRTKRVVQCGMQRRSADLFLEAKKIMDSGQLGESAWSLRPG